MIGVYITSYQKPNKGSLPLLKRAINSVNNQKNKNFMLYVVLDNYTNQDEIQEIHSLLPNGCYIHNVTESYGVKNYPKDNFKRWCTGGLNATTHAINKITSDGIEWVCRLDHDDWWSDDHIETINNIIKNLSNDYVFISTRGKLNNWILPDLNNSSDKFYPTPNKIFHSTTCINFKKIPIRYEDPFKNGFNGPGDAWMWYRLSDYMIKNNMLGYYTPKITLFREKEGDIKNGK
jgi:glycosyltransferase involved in cell wall biosynthesis